MRHSRLTQNYQAAPLSLEVKDSELLGSIKSPARACGTIANLPVPKLPSTALPTKRTAKLNCSAIVRRSNPDVTTVHRFYLRRNLARRIQAAQIRGDHELLQALASELREIVRL